MVLRVCASYRLIVPLLAIGLLVAAGWYYIWPPAPRDEVHDHRVALAPPPEDPRQTFPTPFRNARPGIAYVGDQACLTCHERLCTTYHQHPMGQSAQLPSSSSLKLQPAQFKVLDRLQCTIEPGQGKWRQSLSALNANGTTVAHFSVVPDLVIGSGKRGHSFVYQQQGVIWQAPLSWYSQKQIWDLSPGFHNEDNFQRPIVGECLFCHTNQAHPIANTDNSYQAPVFPLPAAIGCERCHGPGELHVAERTNTGPSTGLDTSIVNPKHLSHELRAAICQQCHLQGEVRVAGRGRSVFEFRPGLPFNLFAQVFSIHPELSAHAKSVGQFEQLAQSTCAIRSHGRLDCTSCHDPHSAPTDENKGSHYRTSCLQCHQQKRCSEVAAPRSAVQDNCVHCHMPKNPSANIAHTAVTDHRIQRRTDPKNNHRDSSDKHALPLQPWIHENPLDEAEMERAYGIALARWLVDTGPQQGARQAAWLEKAQQSLEKSLDQWPDDLRAADTLAELLLMLNRPQQALATIQKILRVAQPDEALLSTAVKVALSARDLELAQHVCAQLVEINPKSFRHLWRQALVHLELQNWPAAEADCQAALQENPSHLVLRTLLATSLKMQEKGAAAERELNTALQLARSARETWTVRNLFAEMTRIK